MSIVALIVWAVTAVGGAVLLGTWVARGGVRGPQTSTFPPALIFGHFALAAIGLVVWIVYVVLDVAALAWIALALLVVVAVLGFGMFTRWLPGYRARIAPTATGRPAPGAAGGPGAATPTDSLPAEQHFPIAVVSAHGVLAVATVVLVLLAALGVGGS